MNTAPFKPKVYLKDGCPFSFKLLLFLAEAGMSPEVDLMRCDPEAAEFEAIKSRLQAGLRKPATFPTAQVEPHRFLADSDALVRYFASKRGIDVNTLPAFSFYVETIFPQLLRLHGGS